MSIKKAEYELLATKPRDFDELESSDEEETFFTTPSLKKTSHRKAIGQTFTCSLLAIWRKSPVICSIVVLIFILFLILSSLVLVFLVELFQSNNIESISSSSPSASTGNSNSEVVESTGGSILAKKDLFWMAYLNHTYSELSLVQYDINQDGVSDFIIDASSWRVNEPRYLSCPNMPSDCDSEFGFSPCRAQILGLNGLNGSIIWEKWVEYSPFSANCQHDFNEDGVNDCIFAGRLGLLVAINIIDGSYIWFADPSVTFSMYNYFSPLIYRDFDHDGILDLIVTHGGDPTYDPPDSNRSPGFIFVLSGRNGQQLSERIPMPDGHETYSSPIAYNISNNVEMILFGSGGETVPGSLWGITSQSLEMHVNAWTPHRNSKYRSQKHYIDPKCLGKKEIESSRPHFEKGTFKYLDEYEEWTKRCAVWNRDSKVLSNPYELCVYKVVSAGRTGTMLPPVVVDIDGDGTKDLLVSQFNDLTILFKGNSNPLMQIWNHTVSDTQSYSIPAPLHFNKDNKLDFLMRFNKGEWMQYDYSYLGVLDGESGSLLWTMNCSFGSMSSPITIKNRKNGHDGMIFIATGCEDLAVNHVTKRQMYDETVKEHLVTLRHTDDTCDPLMGPRVERHESNPDDEDEGHFSSNILNYIPADLWSNNDVHDEFPDPWSETESFIKDYCNIPYNKMITSVYFLTPNMIKSGYISPIYENKPYVYRAPSTGYVGDNRQDKSHTMSDNARYSKRFLRCAHVVLPTQAMTTPIVGDFDNDGRLDVATSVGYDGMPDESYAFPILHPSNVTVQVFNIEDRLEEIFGPSIKNVIQFNSYLPANSQPWKKYMGSAGNGIYNTQI